MKGLAVFTAIVSMAFVLGASAREEPTEDDRTGHQAEVREEPTENDRAGLQDAARSSPGVKSSHSRRKRRALLSSDIEGLLDDALDAKGSVSVIRNKANISTRSDGQSIATLENYIIISGNIKISCDIV